MKWEYAAEVLSIEDGPAVAKRLNEYGADGWEMVGFDRMPEVYSYAFIFKRPLPEEVPSTSN